MLPVESKRTNNRTKPAVAADDALLLAELSALHRHVTGLPDLRIEKVFEVRRAVLTGRYDSETIIESLLDRMSNDIGVLCRNDRRE